jgi:hypothetical protein
MDKSFSFVWKSGIACLLGFALITILIATTYQSIDYYLFDFLNVCSYATLSAFLLLTIILWVGEWIFVIKTFSDRRAMVNLGIIALLLMGNIITAYFFYYIVRRKT